MYATTMSHPKGRDRLLEGFRIGGMRLMARELSNDELVASFLNLPAYIDDQEIVDKVHGWGLPLCYLPHQTKNVEGNPNRGWEQICLC